jgi:hypothetical protein
MELFEERSRQRLRVFFFLILSVAVLWALFLLQQGEMVQFAFMFAALAAINPVVAFIDVKDPKKTRILLLFYILILVSLLWAAFLLLLGVHIWISIFLFIIAVGVPVILHEMEAEHDPAPGIIRRSS